MAMLLSHNLPSQGFLLGALVVLESCWKANEIAVKVSVVIQMTTNQITIRGLWYRFILKYRLIDQPVSGDEK